MKTSDIPMDITEEKINCLDVFINCKPLVKWLQESKSKFHFVDFLVQFEKKLDCVLITSCFHN